MLKESPQNYGQEKPSCETTAQNGFENSHGKRAREGWEQGHELNALDTAYETDAGAIPVHPAKELDSVKWIVIDWSILYWFYMPDQSEFDSEKDRIKKIVDECVSKIGEHADAVQIIASHYDNGSNNSWSYEKGSGNFYTRLGSVSEWVEIQRQYARNWAVKKDEGDDED